MLPFGAYITNKSTFGGVRQCSVICLAERNHLCNFDRSHHEQHFCDLFKIWPSDSGGDVVYQISYLELWRPSCSAEVNHLCKFGREHYGEHL